MLPGGSDVKAVQAWPLIVPKPPVTGEVRCLRLGDLDLEGRCVRIEEAKGLQDRVVYLSPEAVAALRAYLEVRGETTGDHVFLYRHRPLSFRYCGSRLRTYGRRCGVRVTPHQLRHCCATLLLNAGACILTVQAMLGPGTWISRWATPGCMTARWQGIITGL